MLSKKNKWQSPNYK